MNAKSLEALRGQRRTRSENAEYVIETIKSLDLKPHPQSRLMKMYDVLADAGGVISHGSSDFEIALETERDMLLLAFVFDHVDLRDESFVRLVKSALKDSVLPQLDREQSRGRDAQFELYVAGVCYSARMTPVDFAEPDVVCVVEGKRYGIAAKRVKSAANLEKTVRKAANQIERSGNIGVISLDISLALNPDNRRIALPIPQKTFERRYEQRIRDFLDGIPNLQSWISKRGVLGILLHDHNVRWDGDDCQLVSITAKIPATYEQERFMYFADRYVGSLPNLTELS